MNNRSTKLNFGFLVFAVSFLLSGCTLDAHLPCERKADNNHKYDLSLPDDGHVYYNDSNCIQLSCEEDGHWVINSKFSCDYSCSSNKDAVECGECVNGMCSQDDTKICKNGKWVIAAKGECESCKEGMETYVDVAVQDERGETSLICKKRKCISENWVFVDFTCPHSCAGNACGECINGQCNYSGSFSICESGEWKEAADGQCGECENNQCNIEEGRICRDHKWVAFEDGDLEKCKGCDNGDKEVFNDDNGICVIKTCIDGTWDEGGFCTNSCTEDEQCGECINHQSKYENDSESICHHFLCIDGNWVNQNNNPDLVSCNEDKSGLSDCLNGSKKCEDNAEFLCSNGKFSKVADCASCNENECVPIKCTANECKNNESGIGMICLNNELTTCSNGNSCKTDTECGVCKTGSVKYEESNGVCESYICENGEYARLTRCSNKLGPASCNADKTGCGECKNGKVFKNNSKNQCIYKQCSNGALVGSEAYCNKYPCATDESGIPNGCGECISGDKTCVGPIGYYCSHGKWHSAGVQC